MKGKNLFYLHPVVSKHKLWESQRHTTVQLDGSIFSLCPFIYASTIPPNPYVDHDTLDIVSQALYPIPASSTSMKQVTSSAPQWKFSMTPPEMPLGISHPCSAQWKQCNHDK